MPRDYDWIKAIGVALLVIGGLLFVEAAYRAAQSCSANIAAAMRYADRCIAMGARNGGQLAACWNSGSPFTARSHLERAYRMARL